VPPYSDAVKTRMRIEPYLEHIPEIERRIRLLKPDAIVIGLGPTGWLTPWLNQALLENARRFGVHDVFRILPVDDLVIMDGPVEWLHERGDRFEWILKSRPKRWWFYDKAWKNDEIEQRTGTPYWHKHLPKCVHDSVHIQPWKVWVPGMMPTKVVDGNQVMNKDGFALDGEIPETTCMSPVGATTLAWHLGCRRIGVIGMDAIHADHPASRLAGMVNMAMRCFSKKATAAGGAIWNLSPISSITKFDPPSASSSEPTSTNGMPEPSVCLSTASGSTRPATSLSLG
jgi:hypothetical protein